MQPADPADPIASAEPPAAAPRSRRPSRTTLAWGGFGLFLLLLVAYLVLPTLHYGSNLSPPGPAAWDEPQPVAKPAPVAAASTPVPAEAAPPPAAEPSADNADAVNDEADVDPQVASAGSEDDADMVKSIDRARARALDAGKAIHWDGGGHDGYVTPSAPTLDGELECRNVIVSVIAETGQPQSSTERYCRADEDGDWARQ